MVLVAGEAEVDYEVIRCSCPRLTRYIAVDPRKEALDVVREKFKQLPQVQVGESVLEITKSSVDPAQML